MLLDALLLIFISRVPIFAAQSFIIRPSDHSVVQGDTATLKCKIRDPQGPTQWTRGGFALVRDRKIEGYNNRYSIIGDESEGEHNLKIEQAQLEDDEEFECQSPPGLRSGARLTVFVPPKPDSLRLEGRSIKNGGTLEVRAGSLVDASCIVDRAKPAAGIRWHKNGRPVDASFVQYSESPVDAKLTSSVAKLTFEASPSDNNALFSCHLLHPAIPSNFDTLNRINFTLSVLYAPGILVIAAGIFTEGHNHPRSYAGGDVIRAGQRVRLECTVENGNPAPELVWFKFDRKIDSTYTSELESTKNEYSFIAEPADNDATYTCSASNIALPSPLVSSIRLKVHYPPSTVEIQGQFEANSGDTVLLSCISSESFPPSRIKWMVDGKPKSANDDTIKGLRTVSNIQVSIGLEKRDVVVVCYATNEETAETSHKASQTVTIKVQYPPDSVSIYGYDETSLNAGQELKLTCIAIGGNPLPILTWYKGQRKRHKDQWRFEEVAEGAQYAITGANAVQSEFTVKLGPDDNHAIYTCKAKNAASVSETLEASVNLSVNFMPEKINVRVTPEVLRVADGKAVITCQVSSSNPMPEVTWWKGGELIEGSRTQNRSGHYFGWAATSQLQLNLEPSDDKTVYTCRARNIAFAMSIEQPISLDVLYKPQFSHNSPQVVSVSENQSFSFDASATANPSDPIAYQWYKDSEPFGINAPVLNLNNVKRSDAGTYICEATNSEGLSSLNVDVAVQYIPEIQHISETVVADIGENAILECNADGYPQPAGFITWERQDFDVKNRAQVSTEGGKSYLIISSVDRNDSGVYFCVASNGVGSVRKRAVLMVKQPPLVDRTSLYMKAAAREGDVAVLLCRAEGAPEIEIFWLKPDGSFIRNSSKYTLSNHRTGLFKYQGSLSISNVGLDDYAEYECVAKNELGSDRHNIRLSDLTVPDPPTHVYVQNVTHDSITVTWKPGFDGGLQQQFQVRYQKLGQHGHISAEPASGQTTFTINGLTPATQYLISVISINELGAPDNHHKSILAQTSSIDVGVMREGVKGGGPLLEIIVGSLTAGIILLVLNVTILCFFIKRRQRRKLQACGMRAGQNGNKVSVSAIAESKCNVAESATLEKATANRSLDPQKHVHVQMYAHTNGGQGTLQKHGSEYTAMEPVDHDQTKQLSEFSEEDANSMRTIIEVDAYGNPVYREHINPHSQQTFLLEDGSYLIRPDSALCEEAYAEALRSNTLQRRIASEQLHDARYEEAGTKTPVYSAVVKNHGFHQSQKTSPGSESVHSLPPPMVPLRTVKQDSANYATYQQYRPDRNGLIKRYSPERNGTQKPIIKSVNYVDGKPGYSEISNGNCSKGFSSSMGRNSPVLSTFAPGIGRNNGAVITDYMDVNGIEGDLV